MKLKQFPALMIAAALLFSSVIGTVTASAEGAARPEITIGRFNTAPKIDGKFSEAEWGTKSFTLAEGQPNVNALKQKSGDQELPLTKTVSDVYIGYDDSHLYLCVVADYAEHSAQALLGSKLWADDCLQTKISATADGPIFNDIDFGLNTTTNRALAHVWNGNGVTYGALNPGNGKDFMITRTGTVTTYEVAYPLKSFATTVLKLKEGDRMAFSIAQHMSNNGGFYEFAGGIVNSKEITSAGILILGAAKNLPSSGGSTTTSSNQSASAGTSGNTAGNQSSTASGTQNSSKTESSGTDAAGDDENSDAAESGAEGTDNDTVVSTDSDGNQVIEKVVEEDSGFPMGWAIGIGIGILAILGTAFYFLILRKR